MIAAMIYLILVTARIAPKIWDPYDVLGVDRVCTSLADDLPYSL
jgi:preprotein translocase subunit Sec63